MIYNISEEITFLYKDDERIKGRFLLFPSSCFYNLVEVDSGGNPTGKIYSASFITEFWRFERMFKYRGVTCYSSGMRDEEALENFKPIPFPKFKLCKKYHLMGSDFIIENVDYDKGRWVYTLGFLSLWRGKHREADSRSTIRGLPEKNLIDLLNAFGYIEDSDV